MLYELATLMPIPYATLEGEKFNYFKVSQKILNDHPPELNPAQFSPELCDFLRHWYPLHDSVSTRTKQHVPQLSHC